MVDVIAADRESLARYATIPGTLTIDRILEVSPIDGGLGGFSFVEQRIDLPYVKDYDATSAGAPASWSTVFDTSSWGILLAVRDGQLLGGATVAPNVPVTIGQRRDCATLWDIRVATDARGAGIGSALFRAAESWTAERGFHSLVAETQNTNVAACRFYARRGCVLVAIDRAAYSEFPHETMLLWRKELTAAAS